MLDTWKADRLEDVKTNGRTRPLVVNCSRVTPAEVDDSETSKGDLRDRKRFVVKAIGHPEITERHLFCELFGNLIAKELGVNTPKPALIDLSNEFVMVSRDMLERYGIRLRPGMAVGSEFFGPGFTSYVPGTFLTDEETLQARNIYGFDLLAQNPDRNSRKVNCALRSGQLIAYDFELAFSFLLPVVGRKKEPWEVSQHGISCNHIFQPMLRRKRVEWAPFVEMVGKLDQAKLGSLLLLIPDAWQEWGVKVCEHFGKVVDNLARLEVEFQRSLT